MASPRYDRLPWARHFDAARRIQANYLRRHEDYPVHDHEFIEVAVVLGGECLHRTVLGDRMIGRGDAFLFRPGAWHGYERCHGLSIYNCGFDAAILGRELAWMIEDAWLGRLLWTVPLDPGQHGMVALKLRGPDFARSRELLDDLCRLSRRDFARYRADCLGVLVQLLGVLARNVPEKARAAVGRPHRAVQAALKLIDDDPSFPWTLQQLASRAHIEPAYLVRRFRAVAGLPPMAYLRRRRLELAAGLLRRTRRSVAEVGGLVGWPDANYFTRRFRCQFGVSPTDYRRRFGGATVLS